MNQKMKANNYSEGISGDGPFSRPSIMDKFDMLVLRAAEKKRNDIVNRYGDERCSKLLAREEQRREQPRKKVSRSKSHYERTIQDLRDAQKVISSKEEPETSQKEKEIEKPAPVQEQSNDDEDFDIDELFELAWGGDISTGFKKETTNNENNNGDDDDDDKAFAKKVQEGTVRKLLKVRENTRTWRIRRTKSKEKCPESNRSWQMSVAA